MLRYIDNELSDAGKKQVEDFLRDNPEYEAEFRLLQEARCLPDMSVRFADKESLYRREKKPVRLLIGRVAVAACLVSLIGAAGWLFLADKDTGSGSGTQPVTASQLPAGESLPASGPTNPGEAAPGVSIEKSSSGENAQGQKGTVPAGQTVTPEPAQGTEARRGANTAKAGKLSRQADPRPATPASGTRGPDPADGPVADPASGKEGLQRRSGRQESLPPGADYADSKQEQERDKLPTPSVPEYATVDLPPIPATVPAIRIADPPVHDHLAAAERAGVEDEPQPASLGAYVGREHDDGVIYFANTAIPKQNRLRGIFRTATRIIDKVTASQ